MKRRLHHLLFASLALLLAIMLQYGTSQSSVVRGSTVDKYPNNSGIISVKNYGAKGDGVTDDTQAIQTAIKSGYRGYGQQKTIYFPQGTYLVSKPLEWRDGQGKWLPYLNFQGQNRTNTIIKLKNNALGYSNPNSPKAVIVTASQNAVPDGGGNQAFFNSMYDLTVDTGNGNPGAIGIDYMANNNGTIRDVTIRGQGRFGLSLSRAWPGPCLIQKVYVEGFDIGIVSQYHFQFGVTLDRISLANQKRFGIVNENNILSINSLKSANSVPVIKSTGNESMITLLNGDFRGGSSSVSAIENKSALYARNIKTTGYKSVIQNKDAVVPGKTVSEFVSNSVLHLFPSPRKALNLPILNSPEFNEDVSKWVSVTAFGAKPNDDIDDTIAIQKAMDSGKLTVYFPTGAYKISSTIRVRGNVRKIAGMNSFIEPMPSSQLPNPSFRYEPGTSGPLIVERFNVNGWSEQASPQTLVLRDCGHGNYRSTKGAGLLFGENVMIGQWRFEPGQSIWLRQLNTEFTGVTRLVNNGAKLWILGLKTEDPYTVVETKGGGKTEVLGGLLYPGQGAKAVPTNDVAFINNNSQVSLVYVTGVDGGGQDYTVHVQETRDTVTKKLMKSAIPNRGPGSFVMFSD